VERFTRPNIGRIDIDVTIDDPKAYTKPWSVKLAWRYVPDAEPNDTFEAKPEPSRPASQCS
jgi:hypothetical protein